MHILLESALSDEVKEKYIVLPLDTFKFESIDKIETAYCIVENTPISEMMYVDQWCKLHEKLIENFQKQNWKFCEDAIEQLQGRWNGELDSFYLNLLSRVKKFKEEKPVNWSYLISK